MFSWTKFLFVPLFISFTNPSQVTACCSLDSSARLIAEEFRDPSVYLIESFNQLERNAEQIQLIENIKNSDYEQAYNATLKRMKILILVLKENLQRLTAMQMVLKTPKEKIESQKPNPHTVQYRKLSVMEKTKELSELSIRKNNLIKEYFFELNSMRVLIKKIWWPWNYQRKSNLFYIREAKHYLLTIETIKFSS